MRKLTPVFVMLALVMSLMAPMASFSCPGSGKNMPGCSSKGPKTGACPMSAKVVKPKAAKKICKLNPKKVCNNKCVKTCSAKKK